METKKDCALEGKNAREGSLKVMSIKHHIRHFQQHTKLAIMA